MHIQEFEASGEGIRDRVVRGVVDGCFIEWDEDGSNVRPGPNKSNYESARKECGAHLLFNTFWRIKHFCVQQMFPRDGMHAIDLGAIIRLILVILSKYWECVDAYITFSDIVENLDIEVYRQLGAKVGYNIDLTYQR